MGDLRELGDFSLRSFEGLLMEDAPGWSCTVFVRRGPRRRSVVDGQLCQAPDRPERERELERLLISIKYD